MKIKQDIDIVENRYRVSIDVFDPTPVEQRQLDAFGEPLVEVGGTFSGSATRPGDASATNVEFTFPDQQRRMVSDFPMNQYFSLDDSSDADVRAKVFSDEIKNRVTAERDVLLNKDPNFSGENITTI